MFCERNLIFIFLILHCVLLKDQNLISEIYFWHNGQGQWITAVNNEACLHFDFGGEKSFWKENQNLFLQTCKFKKNILFLSHPDQDHYSFLPSLIKRVSDVCWADLQHPIVPQSHLKIPLCADDTFAEKIYSPKDFKTKNESSKVYVYKNLLVPGDSPSNQEKHWAGLIPENIYFLSLGHHGSKTSTGDFLLNKVTKVKMAFAQSRFKKYHHPHPDVIKRLKKYKIPLIKTEDWGTVKLQL